MSDNEAKRLRELEAKADPGPWVVCPMHEYIFAPAGMVSDSHGFEEAGTVQRIRGYGRGANQDANIELLVEARNALIPHLDRIASLEVALRTKSEICAVRGDAILQLDERCKQLQSELAEALKKMAPYKCLHAPCSRLREVRGNHQTLSAFCKECGDLPAMYSGLSDCRECAREEKV